MKPILLTYLFLLTVCTCLAQSYRTETVEWLNPKVYKAKIFTFKSDSVYFVADNCRIFEIRTISGVTGYYLEGDARIQIETKNLMEKCTAAMIRFNPADVDSLITIVNLREIQDDEFVNASLKVLKSTFRHCYHAGMDAIIPDSGFYAVNFFSIKIGEVLVSRYKKELLYYNFTIRSKM